MAPKVSIVMATYNQAQYIEETLDSIRNQTLQDFELIVVNDGCTDETPAILRTYQEKLPFTLIEQANQGQVHSLNNGFAIARGEYLTWTSSDNILLPNMLEVLVSFLDEHLDVGCVYSDWDVIDGEGRIIERVQSISFDRLVLLRHNFINASFLYRRSCQECVGPYDVTIGKKFDWDYWLQLSRICVFRHIPCTLYLYRRHKDSSHVQPDADEHYLRLERKWRRREPVNWYVEKIRAFLQRTWYGQEPGDFRIGSPQSSDTGRVGGSG